MYRPPRRDRLVYGGTQVRRCSAAMAIAESEIVAGVGKGERAMMMAQAGIEVAAALGTVSLEGMKSSKGI